MTEGSKKALISVIVPVYNIASYVRQCIESIQRQTYQNLEIVIVDDGSIDGSGELCEEIAAKDDRIHVIHQKNAGLVATRNVGIEFSTGKYISFIDGDDWIEPDMMEKLLDQIRDADLISSKICKEFTETKIIEEYDEFSEGLYAGEKELLEILNHMIYDVKCGRLQRLTPSRCNKLYLSRLVKKVYKEVSTDINFAEDAVFVYKYLLRCHSVVISHQCFYHYRYRADSIVHTADKHILTNINKVYLALEPDFRNHKLADSLLSQLQKWIAVMCCRAINSHMGFQEQAHITEYIANLSRLEDKALILYGAGKAGQDTYAQMSQYGYHVVLWADRNYQAYQAKGMPVVSPDEIFHTKYDLIFIAVGDETLAESIKKDLVKKGIPEEVLIWRKPMHVF